ncbi:nitrous oxide reductase family maturation protein NosD [Zhengella sp. ZM62]|uniref:right-handed parallel beta-helix repeat-containing protein n=1 Tax=Zhengella sedimenti TaxID=3390035 RepID=UPI003975DDF4
MNDCRRTAARLCLALLFTFPAISLPASAEGIRNASTGIAYDTLTAAIDKARAGDTIEVSGGVHRGNFSIQVPLTLRGIPEGGNRPVLDGNGNGTVLVVQAPGTTVENIAVVNSGRETDPFLYWGAAGIRAEADNVTLRAVEVRDNDRGILMLGGQGSVVESSEVTGNHHAGIQILGGRKHRITGNTVNGNGTGILVDMLHRERRSLLDRATDPEAVARMALDQKTAIRSEDIMVSDNEVRGNAAMGIAAHWYARRVSILSNTVHLTGIERKPDMAMIERVEREVTAGLGGKAVAKVNPEGIGTGIHLFCYVEDSRVENNSSYDNAGSGIGMVAVNTIRVSSNRIAGNRAGIAIESSGRNHVESNTVTDNAEYGIRIGSPAPLSGQSSGNVLARNDITGSRMNAFDNSGRAPAVDDMDAIIEALPLPEQVKQQMRTSKAAREMYLKAMRDAYKPGSNAWDDGQHGNRYGDFDEPEEGFADRNGDGISEAHHAIPGGTSVDRFPVAADHVTRR